jgi:DNA-3-methyladenine glycosylase
VTEPEGEPGAVLIRSVIPLEGRDVMLERRPIPGGRGLSDGPGKLCQALGINLALNETVLTLPGALYVESEPGVDPMQVQITPRIGVRGDEETRRRPWRFFWRPPATYPV